MHSGFTAKPGEPSGISTTMAPHTRPEIAGGTVARAKRTNRAEARRRYRAALAEDAELLEGDEAAEAVDAAEAVEAPAERRVASAVAPRPRRAPAPAAAPPPRGGLGSAFRASFRSPDVAADLRALPGMLLHRSVWLPVLLTVGSAAFFAAVTPPIPADATNVGGSAEQVIASLLFQYFVFSPPVASIFLAGFMAPRASYLTGAIAGLAGAICFALIVAARVGPFVQLDDAAVNQYIASGVVASPLAGIFFGGAAGWYRRFLTLANPNRAARAASARPSDRPRRKSDQRPMLARRR